ncbi:exoribonuclease R [Vibrio sonorensis]|uniref:exoribonuclease R n=1 Tax=Vibrio sonorensis TaxID=1004316 RepID=UPI0008DA35E7|nr:exoribonuclease R [Vibrio sonorensis]
MQTDYSLTCLQTMPREELQTLSMRLIQRLVPQQHLEELFTFESEEVADDEKAFAARMDANLRLTAIALDTIKTAFADSENAEQNQQRMARLLLWHFYAIAFNLESAISLEQHCELAEKLVTNPAGDIYGWMNKLTSLLHQYSDLAQNQ